MVAVTCQDGTGMSCRHLPQARLHLEIQGKGPDPGSEDPTRQKESGRETRMLREMRRRGIKERLEGEHVKCQWPPRPQSSPVQSSLAAHPLP